MRCAILVTELEHGTIPSVLVQLNGALGQINVGLGGIISAAIVNQIVRRIHVALNRHSFKAVVGVYFRNGHASV